VAMSVIVCVVGEQLGC